MNDSFINGVLTGTAACLFAIYLLYRSVKPQDTLEALGAEMMKQIREANTELVHWKDANGRQLPLKCLCLMLTNYDIDFILQALDGYQTRWVSKMWNFPDVKRPDLDASNQLWYDQQQSRFQFLIESLKALRFVGPSDETTR